MRSIEVVRTTYKNFLGKPMAWVLSRKIIAYKPKLAGSGAVRSNDQSSSHIHQFSLTGWRWNWLAVFKQAFHMKFNGLVN